MIHKFALLFNVFGSIIILCCATLAQQRSDPNFNPHVEHPAYTKNFPRVLFDEAHNNFHTATGRYKPFVDMMFSDGYQIAANRKPFSKESLQTYKILIIANALGVQRWVSDCSKPQAFQQRVVANLQDSDHCQRTRRRRNGR